MSLLPPPMLLPLASPRKHRIKHRTAVVALFSLFSFTCYLLFIAYPSLNLSTPLTITHAQDHDRILAVRTPAPPPRKVPQHLQPVPPLRAPLALSQTEELAALAAFIAALPYNVLPHHVDPNAPLDPQLVLDFDPRGDSARDELDRLVEQIWTRFPVMLFAKFHSSDSREVRHILDTMHLSPAPLVIQVDQREDSHVLSPLLARLTHAPGLPLLLVGGHPIGADAPDVKGLMAEIRRLYDIGELTRRMLEAGATVQLGKKKGKGRRGD